MLRRAAMWLHIPPELMPPFPRHNTFEGNMGGVLEPKFTPPSTEMSSSGIIGVTDPKFDKDGKRILEDWEFEPDEPHKSLVFLLYRSILKELLVFQSVRRKSLTAFARLSFRRRGKATEKLLVDECIEEARRAVYVLRKHNDMKTTKEYKYDDMFMPKDTGQDVKTYMEEVYDPQASRASFQGVKDVQPGKEHEHTTGLRGGNMGKGYSSQVEREKAERNLLKDTQSAQYYTHRPPPPPSSSRHTESFDLPGKWEKPER
jgi:hypothetical protein